MKRLLPEEEAQHVHAARGWLELNNLIEACEELERVSPEYRAHPEVLTMRCMIYGSAKKWRDVLTIGET